MKKICSFILCVLIAASLKAESIQDAPEKGWLWYKEEKNLRKKKEDKLVTQGPAAPAKSLSAVEQVKELKEEFEEVLAEAIIHPTLENATLAKNKQRQIEKQAEKFSDAWTKSHLMESNGYSHQSNPHPWHQEMLHKEKEEKMYKKLKKLSKSYGLFFAFKESCPYCHKFAPVVVSFAKTYEFEVKGISADGGVVEGIDNISKDNGALSVINPEGVYPALYLVNPKTTEVIPIAWGMVTIDQLLNNLETVFQQTEIMQ